jgi:hypothetical protein
MSCRPGLRSRLVLSWCADLVLTSSEAKQRPFSEHQCRFPRSINTLARERHSVRFGLLGHRQLFVLKHDIVMGSRYVSMVVQG